MPLLEKLLEPERNTGPARRTEAAEKAEAEAAEKAEAEAAEKAEAAMALVRAEAQTAFISSN